MSALLQDSGMVRYAECARTRPGHPVQHAQHSVATTHQCSAIHQWYGSRLHVQQPTCSPAYRSGPTTPKVGASNNPHKVYKTPKLSGSKPGTQLHRALHCRLQLPMDAWTPCMLHPLHLCKPRGSLLAITIACCTCAGQVYHIPTPD